MNLQLTDEEAEAIRSALASYLSDLRMEIADTDRKQMRDQLKRREDLLRSVLLRTSAAA
jgi:hypothetical protein